MGLFKRLERSNQSKNPQNIGNNNPWDNLGKEVPPLERRGYTNYSPSNLAGTVQQDIEDQKKRMEELKRLSEQMKGLAKPSSYYQNNKHD